MAMAMRAAGGDSSDPDDHELPEKEPEFIVHIVDDHIPPAPPRQMYRPLAAVVPHLQPAAAHLDRDVGRRECTLCYTVKVVHWAVVLIMVGLTAPLAAHLPEEYRTGERVLLLVGPIVIGVVACSWIVLALFVDKERC